MSWLSDSVTLWTINTNNSAALHLFGPKKFVSTWAKKYVLPELKKMEVKISPDGCGSTSCYQLCQFWWTASWRSQILDRPIFGRSAGMQFNQTSPPHRDLNTRDVHFSIQYIHFDVWFWRGNYCKIPKLVRFWRLASTPFCLKQLTL